MAANDIQALVAHLRGPDADDQVDAAFDLEELARNDASLLGPIVAAGAPLPLVEVLRAGTESGKADAVAVIALLAQDTSTHALIVAADALPPLVEVLRAGSMFSQADAARAIGELAKDAATRPLLVSESVLPLLVEMLRAGTEEAENVASLLVQLTTEMQLEDSALRAENTALRRERDAHAEAYEALASLVGPVATGHDVVFRLPGGERIGGSRLLLAHVSPYYKRLLLGGMAEGTSDVEPDLDFSSAAHIALLDLLHALGHVALPVFLDVRLELLCLAAKVRGAPSGEGSSTDAAVRVSERCKRALRESLCADNCLTMLLRLKPYAAEVPGLVDAAHAVAGEHLAVVLKQTERLEFAKQHAESAMGFLQDIALKQTSVVAEQASRLAELTPKADGLGVTRKRPRAA